MTAINLIHSPKNMYMYHILKNKNKNNKLYLLYKEEDDLDYKGSHNRYIGADEFGITSCLHCRIKGINYVLDGYEACGYFYCSTCGEYNSDMYNYRVQGKIFNYSNFIYVHNEGDEHKKTIEKKYVKAKKKRFFYYKKCKMLMDINEELKKNMK